MLTKGTSTTAPNGSDEPKRFDFHEMCIKAAVTVSVAVGTLKFIWNEVGWVAKAVWAWIS